MIDDSFDHWNDGLRHRLATGDLAALGPIDLDDGTDELPGETVVRVLLADLDHLDRLPNEVRDSIDVPTRRSDLLGDFRQLRALLG